MSLFPTKRFGLGQQEERASFPGWSKKWVLKGPKGERFGWGHQISGLALWSSGPGGSASVRNVRFWGERFGLVAVKGKRFGLVVEKGALCFGESSGGAYQAVIKKALPGGSASGEVVGGTATARPKD